jgi:hypothetical protein
MPGVGFPGWNVELLKVRNGKPGSWQIEWAESRFQNIFTPWYGHSGEAKASRMKYPSFIARCYLNPLDALEII